MDAYTLEVRRQREQASGAARRYSLAGSGPGAAAFLLGLALPLYLAVNGGGYERVLRGEVGIAVWWVVIAGVLSGVLPLSGVSRMGRWTLALLLALSAWAGLSALWSLSSGPSVEELSQLACYSGFLALGLLTVRERTRGQLLAGVLCAIAIVAAIALLSRLHPGLFPASEVTGRFLAGARQRLNWPVNYWNALAALIAMGVPLAAHFASGAKRLLLRSLSAACIPMMLATIYLTFSRGGWLELAVGALALLALSGRRLWRLSSMAIGAGGGAILIAAIHERAAVMNDAASSSAAHEGGALIAMTILVCVGVGLLAGALSLIERHRAGSYAALRRASPLSQVRPGVWLGLGAMMAVILFVALGGPSELAHAWRRFEDPHMTAGSRNVAGRLGGLSGEGRWQMWVSCLEALKGHLFGIGAGTFGIWWAAHGSLFGYVKNAHSLYFETLGELGLPGILLLLGFLGLGLWGTLRGRGAGRAGDISAAVTASCLAFCVAAIYDWVWQLPALVAVLTLLMAAGLTKRDGRRREEAAGAKGGRRFLGVATWTLLGLVSVAAIAWPLSADLSIRESISAAGSSRLGIALSDARTAASIEPFSAEAHLQQALVLERQGSLAAASIAGRQAIRQASGDWQSWAVLARIEAERSRPRAALADWRKARSLDPHDPLLKGG